MNTGSTPGQAGDQEIRVSVTEKGEARVYSATAGFTLKNGRSARVLIEGTNAGEWESADSAQFRDEFDSWSLDRDAAIALRLSNAHYNTYYDNDIYGADDLNGYGDWVHTASYGYVWRPYRNSISSYADWSPYRYGTWRWIPPFGWTWVNDEPWGWATYHHGRWIYDAGSWYWTPYGYYRYARSWWFPGLVVFSIFNNNVCWYPLPYHHRYRNYNAHYNGHHGGHHNGQPPTINPTGGIKPIPTPLGPPVRVPRVTSTSAIDDVPPSAVVAEATDKFGTGVKGRKVPPLSIAKLALSTSADEGNSPVLPEYSAVNKRISGEIAVRTPRTATSAERVTVGAAPRTTDTPLDNELRTKRILGGRPPLTTTSTGGVKTDSDTAPEPRSTGAVGRPPVRQPPVTSPPTRDPVKTGSEVKPTRIVPSVRTVTPQSDPAPVRQPPVTAPPVRQPPRTDPPTRQPPRSDPAPVKQRPPTKNEPKPETKPPVNSGKKSADGD